MDKLYNCNTSQLKKYIANRYPFLLIDKAIEIIPGQYACGYKNITSNEWFFPGHFPENPIMPGMLQMEALLQMLSLTVLTMEGKEGFIVRGLSADKIKLKKQVLPGSRLNIEATLLSYKDGIATGNAEGSIDGEKTCSAEFRFTLIDPDCKKRGLTYDK